jgi:aminoglycoside N3'-acetyltransferase
MAVVTSPEQIQREVETAFDRIDSDSLVLHTDLLRMRYVQRGSSLEQQMDSLFQMLVSSSADRTLLFPTFNYDFCRTRVYDPSVDPCQVGSLNEYVRQRFPGERTLTPVFNFCVYRNRAFSNEPAENPFGETSTFAEMVRQRTAVVFLGASFSANTFVHYVEEVADVGYRYLKPFPGVIRHEDGDREILFRYRVRPTIEGAVEYDWDRLAHDLFDGGILHQLPLGEGHLLWFGADRLLEDWRARMARDELCFLTAASRKKTEELYARYGKPLRYEAVEES